jgi:hypothetical protein
MFARRARDVRSTLAIRAFFSAGIVGSEGTAMLADCPGWRSILTALCYAGPFWALLGLSITLFR